MKELLFHFPKPLINFATVFFFSLLIGMEQRRHYSQKQKSSFGTDRTFTFIGILGFVLVSFPTPFFFIAGFLVLAFLLGIFYYSKIKDGQGYGLTSVVLALLVFSMPLMVQSEPRWMVLLLYVLLLLLAELKGFFESFSRQLDKDDFFTLSKFIIMAGIILPVLPHQNISSYLTVSPYQIWLAVVVISSISYISYILKKYIFPESGLLLTGILGGLYSSTGTTFIVARKSNEQMTTANHYAGAILIATAMMYLRIFVLMFLFNKPLAVESLPYFFFLLLVALLTAWWIYRRNDGVEDTRARISGEHNNPLEFKIATIFSLLFMLFSALTVFTLRFFGTTGLTVLSFLVGFTDIDPFLMNLFQGTHTVTAAILAIATLQAIFSNNVLKMVYGMVLSRGEVRRLIGIGFLVNIVAGVVAIAAMYILLT